ncbi:MAG: hypothetical protein VX767_03975, partial [Candidatus Neomarinimicrobiota bacterium]|nr:hypothetical protein [Candidatus Neomarinimicrobiota bacterium]
GDNKISWYENILEGCTNEESCNFNPNAESDDGSCLMLGDIYGSGNINGDNTTDIIDLTLILSYILYEEYLGYGLCEADCNGDANIDLLDIIFIVNMINTN